MFCMPLFSGHGYDEAFAQNMAQVIKDLKTGEPFRLCQASDALCAACPNRISQGSCLLGSEDVFNKDMAALKTLGFQSDEVCNWALAMERLCSVTKDGFRQVCGGCRWQKEQFCTYWLLRERAAREAEGSAFRQN